MQGCTTFLSFKINCFHKVLALLSVLCVGLICLYQVNILAYVSMLDCVFRPKIKCVSSVRNTNGNNHWACISHVMSLTPRRFINDNLIALLCGNSYDVYKINNTKQRDCVSCSNGGNFVGRLLTLFSTWPDGNNSTSVINITCYNWAAMMPLVQPVLFTNNIRAADMCSKRGWETFPVGRTAAGGAPVLKDMFLAVRENVKSLFYGFANGDILFDERLLQTLLKIYVSSLETELKNVLIVGIRTNVNNVTFEDAKTFKSLSETAKRRGKLFIPMSADYFITDAGYPWMDIPEIVIGRRGYDNWLILNALRQNQSVIDVTNTVLAVHQTTRTGNQEGFYRQNPSYNIDLLSTLYNDIQYVQGSTTCTDLFTISLRGGIFITKRTQIPSYCSNTAVKIKENITV